jgi:hypothetical protein
MGNGEGATEDLECGYGSVCTPMDRVSKRRGRLFVGAVAIGSPSNSSQSLDGVTGPSICVLLPQGSGDAEPLSEVGVKGS